MQALQAVAQATATSVPQYGITEAPNCIGKLHEAMQKLNAERPTYAEVGREGPPHAFMFRMEVTVMLPNAVEPRRSAVGQAASSVALAKRAAAQALLAQLQASGELGK